MRQSDGGRGRRKGKEREGKGKKGEEREREREMSNTDITFKFSTLPGTTSLYAVLHSNLLNPVPFYTIPKTLQHPTQQLHGPYIAAKPYSHQTITMYTHLTAVQHKPSTCHHNSQLPYIYIHVHLIHSLAIVLKMQGQQY